LIEIERWPSIDRFETDWDWGLNNSETIQQAKKRARQALTQAREAQEARAQAVAAAARANSAFAREANEARARDAEERLAAEQARYHALEEQLRIAETRARDAEERLATEQARYHALEEQLRIAETRARDAESDARDARSQLDLQTQGTLLIHPSIHSLADQAAHQLTIDICDDCAIDISCQYRLISLKMAARISPLIHPLLISRS